MTFFFIIYDMIVFFKFFSYPSNFSDFFLSIYICSDIIESMGHMGIFDYKGEISEAEWKIARYRYMFICLCVYIYACIYAYICMYV